MALALSLKKQQQPVNRKTIVNRDTKQPTKKQRQGSSKGQGRGEADTLGRVIKHNLYDIYAKN